MQSNNNQFPNRGQFSALPSLTTVNTPHSVMSNTSPQQPTAFTFHNPNRTISNALPLSLPTITRPPAGANSTMNTVPVTTITNAMAGAVPVPTHSQVSYTQPISNTNTLNTLHTRDAYMYHSNHTPNHTQPSPNTNTYQQQLNGLNANAMAQQRINNVPYTVSNIGQMGHGIATQSINRINGKRTRAFDNSQANANALNPYPATKKQRLGDGSTSNMPLAPHGIPPPLYTDNRITNQTNTNSTHTPVMANSRAMGLSNTMPMQKQWRETRQSAKFKMAMDILDQFKANHGGKLPSLRAVMKMLKVGFPKAHEILDAYAAHIGVTKEKLMQDMTVRQEKKRSDSNKSRRRTTNSNSTRTNGNHASSSNNSGSTSNKSLNSSYRHNSTAHTTHNNGREVPKDVNMKLQSEILEILQCTQNGDKRGCYSHCSKLEELVTEYEDYYSRLSVNDRLRLAQSYFLLGSMYREKNSRNFAYSYVERALSTFRDCNGLAQQAGYHTETVTATNDNNNNKVSSEDIGHFWPQIVEVYILGGHILLANAQYSDAKDMYELAHNLAIHIKTNSTKAQITVSEALENLAVVSMYDNKVEESIKYTKRILEILESHNEMVRNVTNNSNGSANTDEELTEIPFIKILNARAYYSCCLTLSCNGSEKAQGYDEYRAVVRDAKREFGEYDARTIGFYCYFGLHFVQIKDWRLSHAHIDHILEIDDIKSNSDKYRKLETFEKSVINDLWSDYLKAVIALNGNGLAKYMQGFSAWISGQSEVIHEKQLRYANEINNAHFESLRKYNSVSNGSNGFGNGQARSNTNTNNGTRQSNDSRFKSHEFKQENGAKVNVISILCNHIRIFMILSRMSKASEIIRDLVIETGNKQFAMNEKSRLLSSYLTYVKSVRKNEIDELGGLYHQIVNNLKGSHNNGVKTPPKPQTPLPPRPPQFQTENGNNRPESNDTDIDIRNNKQ